MLTENENDKIIKKIIEENFGALRLDKEFLDLIHQMHDPEKEKLINGTPLKEKPLFLLLPLFWIPP